MIVVDASTIFDLLVDTGDSERIANRLLSADDELHAPGLLDVEVTHALRRIVLARELEASRGRLAIDDLLSLPVDRHPHELLLHRAWELRASVSAYDAMYIALAEMLAAPLITRDAKLVRSHGHRAKIELI